jgi:glycosyltransferase involved in cell wall biosynthesis
MAYVIFGDYFTFPDGTASTNRVYTYAKGFIENGVPVHVICFRNDYMDKFNGQTEGINYYHPFGQTKRNRYFVIRRWQKFLKYIRTLSLLKEINKANRIIAIQVYTEDIFTQLFSFILAKTCKTKLLIERSEHPLRNFQDNCLKKFSGKTKVAIETKLYDGIFCISNFLIDFYDKRGFSRQRICLVPSTVDTGRFNHHFSPPLNFKYILYVGSLTIQKDGVNILIESYAKICDKYPELKLVLIGEADTLKEELMLKGLVSSLKIDTERVVFLGRLPRNDIPAYLCNAEILALARPQNIISDAGFPSKLTEYLATGKPAVVTRVGEIPVYLQDNETAFLSEPDSAEAFAGKLDFVLSNYEFAQKVGLRGKDLTATVFNYNYQAKRMLEFIKSL